MKRVPIILIIIVLFASNLFSKIGISIIETKDFYNSGSNITSVMQKHIEILFSKDKEFSVKVNPKKFLEEIQLVLVGVAEGKSDRKMIDVDYVLISGIGSYGNHAIMSIRVVDIGTYKIVAGKSKVCDNKKILKNIENIIKIIKEDLKKYIKKGKRENDVMKKYFTTYKFVEEGNKGISQAILWMLSSEMVNAKGINLIEREGSYFIMKEKELEMAGLVNRNPLKKYRKMYQIDFSIDGLVISQFEDLITVSTKIVDASTSRVLFTIYVETPSISDLPYLINTMIIKIIDRLDNFCKFEIATAPKEVLIFIDNEYVGRSDALITDIEAGKHTIRLEKRDYNTVEFDRTALRWQTIKIYKKLNKQEVKHYKLGLTAEQKKEWDRAIENFKKFIALYPNTSNALDAMYRIAHIYQYELKNYLEAIKYYNTIIDKYPDTELMAECFYGIGRCRENLGEINEARKIYQMLKTEYKETSSGCYAITRLEEMVQ